MFIHSLSECSLLMTHILFMAPNTNNAINDIIGFTITFHDGVIFPFCDGTPYGSSFVQFWTTLATWTRTAFFTLPLLSGSHMKSQELF